MNSFVFWFDRPFDPRRGSHKMRRRGRFVTIRYSGSFGRSAVKALIVLAFLATLSKVIGERPGHDLAGNKVAYTIGAAIPRR